MGADHNDLSPRSTGPATRGGREIPGRANEMAGQPSRAEFAGGLAFSLGAWKLMR